MIYADAISLLGQARRFGMKLGLESMRDLASKLGDPQKKLRFVHLAGTNGKGSTAAFCESCLRASGFRVGLFTSPHLVGIRERIQIDRVPISEADFAEGMTEIQRVLGHGEKNEVTFFELMTALALWYFARENVDWVVWETGLGGRLDATNIVTPEICIITNIGLDHQKYLGETLGIIAREKAGIIKPGVPVISAVDNEEAAEVIRQHAQAAGSTFTLVHRDGQIHDLGWRGAKQIVKIGNEEFSLGLLGPHQVMNAACAVEAVRYIASRETNPAQGKNITEATIARGLEHTVWPGRFEILSTKPLVVMDGAHNPAGLNMLVETWRSFLASSLSLDAGQARARTRLVFASVDDKDISKMAQILRPLAREVSLVRLANERSADPTLLAHAFSGLHFTCYNSVTEVWQSILNADPEALILITGSLFLVGEMLARWRGDTEEYTLNERLEKFAAYR